MVSINADARPHEVVEDVWLGPVGTDGPYTFTATQAPDLLSAYLTDDEDEQVLITIQAKYAWVEAGFDDATWEHISARLADRTDWFSTASILNLYGVLMEEVTNRPPTSPNGSSRTPSRRTGAAKPKPKGATSGA